VVVAAAVVGVRFASAGVAEVETVDDARAVAAAAVGRRKPVPAAAGAVCAHPSALHSQGLHS